jgi:lanosterol synthase
MYYSEQLKLESTDPSRWRLVSDELGRETWHYLSEEQAKQIPNSTFVQYLLQDPQFPTPEPSNVETPFDAAKKGADFLQLLQLPNGVFPCQYKGPMFMTVGYVVSHYYCGIEIPQPYRAEMIRYIVNTAHPVDGGWGLHSVDKSTCFGTTMNYLCLRLLGLPADHPVCVKSRKTLLRLGGATNNPHWGKAWLSVLNLYQWEGVNPSPPETWILPPWLPLQPGNWWVHTRAIYLPMGYILANKIQCKVDPLILQLRQEIYCKPYDKINFKNHRNTICGVDLYFPHSKLLDFANAILSRYESVRPKWILNYVNKRIYEFLLKDYENTQYLSIAPISYAFSLIVTHFHEGPSSETFKKLYERANDVLFHGPQGMCVMGTNGVQVWDAAFMVQYFYMTGLASIDKYHEMIKRSYLFLVRSQFTEDCQPGSFRDKRKGGWPFSTKEQGYTVSDCTAEAMKAIIMVRKDENFKDVHDCISDENLYDAVEVLLSLQNVGSFEFGSFSTYEKIRTTPYLEMLNPAEVFNNIMVEYPYVECTDSSVLGLTYFAENYPKYQTDRIRMAIENAINYIIKVQDDDGSWYGCWGVCYTYASMFALEALNTVHKNYENCEAVKRGCDFLVSKQLPDGGWSESMKSCETHTYVNSSKSLVVQTAWALIGLILADYPNQEVITKGIKLLMDRQLPSGEWKFEDIEGVFNHSCAIEYPSYKFLFTIKALGLYKNKYGDVKV